MFEEVSNYFLDTVREEDVPVLVEWFNDPALCRYMEDSEPDKRYGLDDVFSMIRNPTHSVYLALRHQNALVGYASLYDFKPQGEAEFSFLIGHPEFRGRKLGGVFVGLLCDKAKELGVKKLTCSVVSKNEPSIRCVQKNGFAPISQGFERPPFMEMSDPTHQECVFEKHL